MKKLKELEKLNLAEEANVEMLHHAQEDNFSFLQEDDLNEILGGYCARDYSRTAEGDIYCGCGYDG